MALTKCPECKIEVSTKADRCPHCGAPIKKKTGGCALLFAIFAGVFLLGYVVSLSNCAPQSAPSSPPRPPPPAIQPMTMPLVWRGKDQNVSITIQYSQEADGRVVVRGNTNLPATTHLMISLDPKTPGKNRMGAECAVLADGTFVSPAFGPNSGVPEGQYTIDIVVPFARFQPAAVRALIGEKGQNLNGPLVEDDPVFGHVVHATLDIVCTMFRSPTAAPVLRAANGQQLQDATDRIPADVSFRIEHVEILPSVNKDDMGRRIDVRINGIVSKEVLTEISKKLEATDSSSYQRTFIDFRLYKEMDPWAQSHFNPDFNVEILGFTLEQKRAIDKDDPMQEGYRLVGEWIVYGGPFPRRTRILKTEMGGFVINTRYRDSSLGNDDLDTKITTEGAWFAKRTNANGEYYIINHDGDLEIRDAEGLFETIKKR